MNLAIFYIGVSDSWLGEAERQYQKKISYLVKFEIRSIKPSKLARSQSAAKKDLESRALLDAIDNRDYVILLDEAGKEMRSIQAAKVFSQQFVLGSRRVCFVVGGAFGVNDEVRSRANFVWSLSQLTFNHEIARIVLLEQIYRMICIERNLPYHNEG